MENCQLILNSNGLCVICLSEVEAKVDKADLFPLHHLTSKINSNLGSVFKDVTVPWAPNAVMDRLEILADVCEGCAGLCEELLYNFQDDVGREKCIKLIIDKTQKVGLEEKYRKCGSSTAIFYAGIVDRLRTEIIDKLHLKPELEGKSGAPAGLQGIPNLLNIPDLPLSQICSYLSFKDIKNCLTVNKGLRHLVFPSFIKSSFITFQNQSQIPAMIDFIKAVTTNTMKGVNLLIEARSINEYSGNPWDSDGSDLLNLLFQECGSHIIHLKLSFGFGFISSPEQTKGFLSNCVVVARSGNVFFPNLKKLDLFYYRGDDEDLGREYPETQMIVSLALVEPGFRNSPSLTGLKVKVDRDNRGLLMKPLLFKFIRETGLHLESFEADGVRINGEGLAYLEYLNLKRVVLDGYSDSGLDERQALTNFLGSQGNSLKYLELGTRCHFTFPRMEALETLKLNGDDEDDEEDDEEEEDDSGPIFNQTQLPNLKTIEVFGEDDEYLETLLENYSEPTTSVKELRLLIPSVDKVYLSNFASVFKCLSKLEVPVALCLNGVWKDLSGLEELTLLPNGTGAAQTWEKTTWIDKIITGLRIQRDCLSAITHEDLRRHEEKYEKRNGRKSMALLKRLRLLRIRHKVWYLHGQRLMLSDLSCRLVLMKMESLKCIDFCGIHSSFVGASRKVLDEMEKKMDLYFGQERDWQYESLG